MLPWNDVKKKIQGHSLDTKYKERICGRYENFMVESVFKMVPKNNFQENIRGGS